MTETDLSNHPISLKDLRTLRWEPRASRLSITPHPFLEKENKHPWGLGYEPVLGLCVYGRGGTEGTARALMKVNCVWECAHVWVYVFIYVYIYIQRERAVKYTYLKYINLVFQIDEFEHMLALWIHLCPNHPNEGFSSLLATRRLTPHGHHFSDLVSSVLEMTPERDHAALYFVPGFFTRRKVCLLCL